MAGLLVIGGFSCCVGFIFSIIGRRDERNAEILNSVTRVKNLNDLVQLLDAERPPLVVTISGRVASETPIECKMTGLRGVIVEKSKEKLYLQKDVATEQEMKCNSCKNAIEPKKTFNDADSWTLCSKIISSIYEEVPWYLDDGTDRVHVVGARGAAGFVLPARRSTFKESDVTLVYETWDKSKREKMLGFKKIEWVLPVGTSLNVVGEASKGDDGTVRIQRPPNGPFYVSCKTIDEHTRDLVVSSRWCKDSSVALTGLGAYLIAMCAISYIFQDNIAVNYEKGTPPLLLQPPEFRRAADHWIIL